MAMTEAKKRNEGTMTLRVDRDLLTAFQNIAKDNNRTASQLVRDYMMNYVKKHGQGIYRCSRSESRRKYNDHWNESYVIKLIAV